jgi:hypothetical protein
MKDNVEHGKETQAQYKLAGQWQINMKASAQVAITAGAVLLIGLSFILGTAIRGLLRSSWEEQFSFGGLIFFPIILGVILAVMILHEAVHGLVFLVAGAKPRFGVKLIGKFFPVAYASSKSCITRNQYLLVILAPFFIITLVFLVTAILANTGDVVVLALAVMAMNVGGSLGDLIMAWKIRQHDGKTLFEDTEDGFTWYVLQTIFS